MQYMYNIQILTLEPPKLEHIYQVEKELVFYAGNVNNTLCMSIKKKLHLIKRVINTNKVYPGAYLIQ